MSLYVKRLGDGDDRHYFCIHGWGGGWQTFEPLLPYLPADASLWCVDLPGYGQSAPLDEWRWEHVATALMKSAATLPGPLTLVGNCSGAACGLMAALQKPGCFDRLVLIDPFAYCPWYFSLLVSKPFGRLFYATAFENPLGRWITNEGLADHRAAETHLTGSFENLDHDVVFAYLKMLTEMPEYRDCGDVEQPISVVYGAQTFDAVRKSVDMWLSIWPQATAVELAGAGHLPIQEATAKLADVVFGVGK